MRYVDWEVCYNSSQTRALRSLIFALNPIFSGSSSALNYRLGFYSYDIAVIKAAGSLRGLTFMTSLQTRQLGNYIILDRLAVGSTTEHFRAMSKNVQAVEKLITIKKLLPHLAGKRDLISSFIAEANLAALLDHPNIVQIHELGKAEDIYFIAMEYLQGKDCRSIVERAKEKNIPLDLQLAIFIVSRICTGLDYTHKLKDFQGKDLKIVHQDISPQTIFITYDGEVKIIDFAIAGAVSRNIYAKMQMAKGKIAYMSPEQAMGKVVDHRSDIFSCGTILYELITGKPLFSGGAVDILTKIKEADFVQPEELRNDLPEKLLRIFDRALQKKPEDRYQSCGNMLNDLEECIQHGPLSMQQELAKYMHTLFAEEIAKEQRHLQRLSGIGGIEFDRATPVLSAQPTDINVKQALIVSKPNFGPDAVNLNRMPVLKKLSLALLGVCFLLGFGLVAVINQIDAETSISQIADKTQPVQEIKRREVSTKTEETETYQKGMAALIGRRFKEAIACFEELRSLDPETKDTIALPYTEALIGLARTINETDPEKAIDLYKQAIQLDPNRAQAFFQLGMLFMKQKKYPDAIKNFENVIKLNPELPNTYFNLGYIYAMSKNYTKAEEMYIQAVELKPSYQDEALYNLALVQSKLHKDKETLANLLKAVRINPNNTLAQNYLKKLKGVSVE